MLWRSSLTERAFHDGLPYNGCNRFPRNIRLLGSSCRPTELRWKAARDSVQKSRLVEFRRRLVAGSLWHR